MPYPEHACALLLDHAGWLVLQLRPASARHAANQLTCYGGKCEPGEDASTCLGRELEEELGWQPGPLPDTGIDLRADDRWIARFLPVTLPSGVVIRPEPGFIPIRAPLASLPGLPLSPWHRLVLTAWQAGTQIVHL
jgi:8-oxo-dGTP pyrophosphatase MutT (NUDIX family)